MFFHSESVIFFFFQGVCFWPQNSWLTDQWCVGDRKWWIVGLDVDRGGLQVCEQRSSVIRYAQPKEVDVDYF